MVNVASALAITVFLGVGYTAVRYFLTDSRELNTDWFR